MTDTPIPLPAGELPPIGLAAVCLGVFDGVHLGHRALLDATHRAAQALGGTGVALAFDPPPDEVVRPGRVVAQLTPLRVRLDRIRGSGVRAVPIEFNDDLRELSAEAFLDALAPGIELRALVMSPDAAFGARRAGTFERMRELGGARGFAVVSVATVLRDGERVSSSRIRGLVAAGEVRAAGELLGAPPYLEGTVVVGDRRGRALGYPTANLEFAYHAALPAHGVYVGSCAVVDRGVGAGHPAIVSVGVRPTFHRAGALLVEVHLLDFDGDLYGGHLELELFERLREERTFEGADALVAQMHRDEAVARAFLAGGIDG